MIRILNTFLLCPISEDQKPMTDYLRLKENKLLILIIKNTLLFFSFFLSFLFCLSFFWNSFFYSFFFNMTILNIILFVYYLQYKNIIFALSSSRLFYEETSWYDGAFWNKPFFIIKNDRLLTSQKIKIFFKKLQIIFFFFLFFFVFFFLFFLH
jgi:hypothetical protein